MSLDRRRVPQQQRSGRRVAAILTAARSLLQEHDPADVTTRAVAIAAGVSPATVYRYFSDMDDIVDALVAEHAAIAESTVAEALADADCRTIGEVFELVARTYLDLYARRPELIAVWRSPVLAERQRRVEESSDQSLALAVGDHLVRCGLLHEMTPVYITLLNAHWTTAGALIGVILRTDQLAQPPLIDELIALTRYLASRY